MRIAAALLPPLGPDGPAVRVSLPPEQPGSSSCFRWSRAPSCGRIEHMVDAEEWVGVPDSLLLDGSPSPAAVQPSGWLALELDQYFADPSTLDDPALIDALVGYERVVAWAQARQARLIAELSARRAEPGGVTDWAADEVGTALHLSSGTAAFRTRQAEALVSRLPDTLAAWEAGLLDQRRVTVITEGTANLSDEHAALVEARVLPRAPRQTAAQLRAAVKRAIIAADPAGAQERHERARRDRRVAVNPEPDGMASLWALLPAPDAVAAYEWLTRLARGCGAEDPRSMDERRADLLADLLSGRVTNPDLALPTPVNPGKPLVQLLMPMTSLFGLTDDPCELLGYGPITAEMAREIAATAVWRRLLFDPATGALLDHGRTTYTPPAALAEFVRARDVYCRFPGCRRKVVNGELDHITAFADGGATSAANLAGYCVRHHHLKHAGGGWQVRALPDGGLEWITPTGHTHITRPYDYRADPDPP
ncbi:DUF222 domain-containing protein [Pseudonocardia sp. CA-107938]|uniref:HNH endonuclease signature motif containing protein n=1 Tax=Pseudonocardia sp. CA-107938 TaxID=3240021 RepID=UPI003D8D8FB4